MTDTATPGEDDTPTATEGAEPMTDTVGIYEPNTVDTFSWNPWMTSDNTFGWHFMTELDAFTHVQNGANWQGNPTFEAPQHRDLDEIEIVTWVTDYEVEEPFDMWNYHDDRSTFWNGEPYDAQARYLYDKIDWFQQQLKFEEGEAHRAGVEDQWTYHWWQSKGEVPGSSPEPRNATVLGNGNNAARTDGNMPLPPEWSQPWVDQFENVGTSEEYTNLIEELRGTQVTLSDIAENQWGSGPYKIDSTDDIGSDSVILTLREDHPHADHATIDHIELYLAQEERENVLAGNGEIDIHEGSVTPNNQWNRESLPNHVREIIRYLKPDGGDSLWWNMNNPHLENLWFRRAIVSIIDFEVAGANGWGEQRSIPLTQDSGLLDAVANAVFSEDFLDSLHLWPKNAAPDTAEEYMQNGGFERQGGTWVGPEGEEASLDLQIPGYEDWIGAAQTMQQQLQDFGINCTYSQYTESNWSGNLNADELNYDMSIHWYGQANPFGHYKSQTAWWDNGSIIGGGDSQWGATADEEYTRENQPLQVHLPTEPGDISAPTGAEGAPYNPPNLEGVTDYEEVNIIEVLNALQQPAESEEAVQERFRTAARYYNYYLPKFAFHQYTFGEWGNVRDLNWPPEDHNSLKWERSFNITDSVSLGGIIQASYDDGMDRELPDWA